MVDGLGPSEASSVLTIDLGALKRNYYLLASRAHTAECAAVVKANGYGLGIEQVFHALNQAGCTTFFVATLDEAITLRMFKQGPTVYYLNGLLPGEAEICRSQSIRPTLNDLGQIEYWAKYCSATRETLPAAIHIDTGMSRLGLTPRETVAVIAKPGCLEAFDFTLLLSHLACGEMPYHPMNVQQRDQFSNAADALPHAPRSLAASSGIFLGADWHFDMVRAGVSLYGVSPQPDQPNPMEQVIQLQGKIIQVRDVDTPQTVGYGASYQFNGPMKVATVAAGYADGIPRNLDDQSVAYIGNKIAPIIGRVSMDLITLDISSAPEAKPGDMVDLIGPHNNLDAVAASADTIGYELLTRLGHRYRRRYIETTK